MTQATMHNPTGTSLSDSLLGAAAVLVVDDEPGICNFLQRALRKCCALLEIADNAEQAEALRKRIHFDLIIVDIRMPGISGLQWVQQIRESGDREAVIFMTAFADLETAITAFRAGATDFIVKPFRIEQILAAARQVLGHRSKQRENQLLRREMSSLRIEDELLGDSSGIRHTRQTMLQVAASTATILIEGETGSGKDLVARGIHKASRRDGLFIPLNCGSMPAELLESELFGHTKGAFTGAHAARDGLFSAAHRGTLFLDEISELPLPLQAKLLRVLEERSVRPVGANRELPVDTRVVAATNTNLMQLVGDGFFREDLYYRLAVVTICVPPLRERPADISLLAKHFIAVLSRELGVAEIELSHHELQELATHSWPGNVRELRNLIERSLLLGVPPLENLSSIQRVPLPQEVSGYPIDWTLAEVEQAFMRKVLAAVDGNQSAAARRLGVSRKTMERKIKQWANQ